MSVRPFSEIGCFLDSGEKVNAAYQAYASLYLDYVDDDAARFMQEVVYDRLRDEDKQHFIDADIYKRLAKEGFDFDSNVESSRLNNDVRMYYGYLNDAWDIVDTVLERDASQSLDAVLDEHPVLSNDFARADAARHFNAGGFCFEGIHRELRTLIDTALDVDKIEPVRVSDGNHLIEFSVDVVSEYGDFDTPPMPMVTRKITEDNVLLYDEHPVWHSYGELSLDVRDDSGKQVNPPLFSSYDEVADYLDERYKGAMLYNLSVHPEKTPAKFDKATIEQMHALSQISRRSKAGKSVYVNGINPDHVHDLKSGKGKRVGIPFEDAMTGWASVYVNSTFPDKYNSGKLSFAMKPDRSYTVDAKMPADRVAHYEDNVVSTKPTETEGVVWARLSLSPLQIKECVHNARAIGIGRGRFYTAQSEAVAESSGKGANDAQLVVPRDGFDAQNGTIAISNESEFTQ